MSCWYCDSALLKFHLRDHFSCHKITVCCQSIDGINQLTKSLSVWCRSYWSSECCPQETRLSNVIHQLQGALFCIVFKHSCVWYRQSGIQRMRWLTRKPLLTKNLWMVHKMLQDSVFGVLPLLWLTQWNRPQPTSKLGIICHSRFLPLYVLLSFFFQR